MTPVRKSLLAIMIAAVAASAAVDPALLSLVPSGATAISGIQVEQSKASKFGQYVLGQMSSDDPGMTKFIAATGFDPRRDLTEIVAAATGSAGTQQGVVLGRGVFNPARIVTTALAAGAIVTDYKGIQLIGQKDAKTDGVVGFLDASTAVMGTSAAVKAVIDGRNSGQKLDIATQNKVNDLANANDAWFISMVPPSDFFAGKLGDSGVNQAMGGANLFQAVKAASGGVKFTAAGIQISGEALTRSDQDATALADVIRFIAGLIQQNKDPKAQQAATLLQTLQLSTQASTLKLSLSVPEALMEQLFMPHPHMKGAAHPHKTVASLR